MSLLPSVPLTPPSTRSRKENLKPSPSSPSRSPHASPNQRRGIGTPISPFRPNTRVNFAPHKDSHYPHSPKEPPRRLPSSRLWGRPSRSILKRPSLTNFNFMAPPEEQLRQWTPEPEGTDALTQEHFITSPLKVIVTSVTDLTLSLRDVTEAWTLLFARLRARFPSELPVVPALAPLKANIDAVLKAAHRDVERALVDPLQSKPKPQHDLSKDVPGPKKRGGMTEFEVTYARDLFMLSNAALRFVSLICWVPQLYECVTDEQLSQLMDVILRILDTSTLPSNTPRKTYGLALAILQVQRLPERILGPFVGRISSAIRRGLDGEYGREGKKGPAWESLGALQTLADGEIIAFHEHFPQLFNSLLSYLVSPCSTSLRLKAAIALGALGHYSLLHRIEGLVVPVMRASAALSPVLTTAFQKGGLEGAWAVTVLAAIVALTGYQFHLSRKWMKTFMHCSQTGLNAKKDVGMKFASRALWCFLLWAWEDGHAQGIEGFQANDDTGLMIRQAKRTQEGNIAPVVQAPLLQRPMGASLVAAFIGDGSDQEAVATGISVLHEMFVNHSPLNIELLFRLLAFFVKTGDERIDLKIGESDVPWKYSKLVCTPILNGSLIANADMNSFIQSAKDMLSDDANGSIRLADVRPLDGEEVTTHWDKLMRCWDTMFKQGLALSDSSIQSTCHKLWVALVKARVSAASTLVERKALSRSMVDRIASFLEKSPSEWAPESALSIGASQCSISAASAMFSALVHEADSEKSFPSFPMDLLDRVVQTNVSLSTPEIRTLWRDFIVGIVRVGSEDSAFFEFLRNRVLAENCARRAPPQSGAVQKAVWGSVWDCAVFLVTQTPLAELSVKWEDIVLLTQCIPFSDADPNVEWSIIEARWNTIIQAAVERCDLINVSRACLIEKAVSCISHQRIGLRGSMKALSLLFSLLENNEKRTLDACKDEDRTQGLYDLFNKLAGGDALTTASLVPEGSRHLEAVLDCISVIERVVRTTPPKFVVSRLCNLQPGLLPWLRDEHAVLTELQYNTVIANFYSTSLEALLDAESSATILHKITPFLVSGFVRLPPPLLCPNAFESFWTAKYKPITDELTREGYQYPEELKVCLRYFIYSGSEHESFAVGLSAGIESIDEVNEESFVPESVNVEAPTRSSPDHSSLVADDAERIANNPGLENASFVPEHQILVANSSSSDVPDDPDIARIISTDQLPSSPDDTGRLSPAVISSDKIADVSVPSLLGNPIRGHQALSSPDGVSDEEAEANSVATSLVEGEMFSSPKPQQRVYGPGSSGKRKRGLSGKLARKRHRPRKSEDTSSFIASLVRGTMGPSPHLPAVKSHSDRPPEPKPAPKAGHAPKLDLVTPTKVGSNAPERHGKVEVEVPRLVQAWKGHKARSSSVSNEPSPCSSPTDHRRSQRLKRDLSALNVNEEVLPQTDGNKIGPPRPKRHKSSTDISPQRQNPRSRKSKKSFASGSSDVTSPQKGPTPSVNSETPQIRGPVLPALVDTVISPELKRNEQLDNPSSDDSTQPGSSPIRSHVQRRLSRNNSSGLLGPKSRLNVHRVPAPDSIKDAALILASTSNEQLVSMSAEELRHLRSLIDGLEGKVQNALSSKSDS